MRTSSAVESKSEPGIGFSMNERLCWANGTESYGRRSARHLAGNCRRDHQHERGRPANANEQGVDTDMNGCWRRFDSNEETERCRGGNQPSIRKYFPR